MIAARLAGGNLFLPFFWWGFLEHSEHSDFFLRGFFFGGWWGGVLDCKCWKKLKND